jgi:NADH-quinone oxidoreductase subunit H
MPEWVQEVLTSKIAWAVGALIVGYVFALVGVPIYVWWERRGAAVIQQRPGPNRRGPYGLLQVVADAIKLGLKEDVVPSAANKWLHGVAPMITVMVALCVFAVIPFSLDVTLFGDTFRLQVADLNFGIIYVLAISSISVYSGTLAGWSSNNKYSLLGGLRAGAQMISYEIAMGLAVVSILLAYGSVRMSDMVAAQAGSIWNWGVFQVPIGFLIYIIAAYAETNRTPFDLVEADSELVAGFFTEYSSFKFGLFFVGEYMHQAIASVLIAVLFFGGANLPWADADTYPALFPYLMFIVAGLMGLLALDTSRPKRRVYSQGNLIFAGLLAAAAGVCILMGLHFVFNDVAAETPWLATLAGVVVQLATLVAKFAFFFWLFIWVRWTVPRFRYDQLMNLGWKVLLPLGLFNIALTSVLVLGGWI